MDFDLDAATLIQVRAGDSSGTPLRQVVTRALRQSLENSVIATEDPPPEILDPPFAGGNNPYGVGARWGSTRLGVDPPTAKDAFGLLVVQRPPPFYVSIVVGQAVVQTKRVAPGEDEIAFVINDSDLEGLVCSATLRVLDASSAAPLPARVSIRRKYRTRWSGGTDVEPGAQIELSNLCPGPATLRVEADERATIELPIDLRPGEVLQLGDVFMGAPTSIFGTVEDPSGGPLALKLKCQLLTDSTQAPRTWRGQSDAAGSFQFDGMPRGRYTLHVRGDDEGRTPGAARSLWTSAVLTVDARGAAPSPIVLVAEPPIEVAIDLTSILKGTRLAIEDTTGTIHRRLRADRDVWALKLPQAPMALVINSAGDSRPRRIPFQVTSESLYLDPTR